MKTITFLTTFTIAVSLLISGCTINPAPDLDRLANAFSGMGGTGSGSSGGGLDANGQPYAVYGPTVWMDSLAHENDSTATLWGHYKYDSVLIIQNSQLNYSEFIIPVPHNQTVIIKRFQSMPDTIDFRALPDSISTPHKEWTYTFSVKLDTVKSNTLYHLSVVSNYLYKKDESRQMSIGFNLTAR